MNEGPAFFWRGFWTLSLHTKVAETILCPWVFLPCASLICLCCWDHFTFDSPSQSIVSFSFLSFPFPIGGASWLLLLSCSPQIYPSYTLTIEISPKKSVTYLLKSFYQYQLLIPIADTQNHHCSRGWILKGGWSDRFPNHLVSDSFVATHCERLEPEHVGWEARCRIMCLTDKFKLLNVETLQAQPVVCLCSPYTHHPSLSCEITCPFISVQQSIQLSGLVYLIIRKLGKWKLFKWGKLLGLLC